MNKHLKNVNKKSSAFVFLYLGTKGIYWLPVHHSLSKYITIDFLMSDIRIFKKKDIISLSGFTKNRNKFKIRIKLFTTINKIFSENVSAVTEKKER